MILARRARSASRTLRNTLATARAETIFRGGDWIIAAREVAFVSAGSASVACSGMNDSGTSWFSLEVDGVSLASSASYSNTSGIPSRVGEKGAERGVSGS